MFTVADKGRLEIRGHGDRQAPAVHVLHRHDGGHGWHIDGRAAHLRIRRPRSDNRNIQGQIKCATSADTRLQITWLPRGLSK